MRVDDSSKLRAAPSASKRALGDLVTWVTRLGTSRTFSLYFHCQVVSGCAGRKCTFCRVMMKWNFDQPTRLRWGLLNTSQTHTHTNGCGWDRPILVGM
jgi:hypothetical protein